MAKWYSTGWRVPANFLGSEARHRLHLPINGPIRMHAVHLNPSPRIETLAREIDALLGSRWVHVVERHHRRLERLFRSSASRAHAAYLRLALRPAAPGLQKMGLVIFPGLPGSIAATREWRAFEESHLEQWFGVTVCTESDEPVGMLITVLHAGTARFEIKRRPSVSGIASVRFADAQALGRASLRRIDDPRAADSQALAPACP